MNLLLIFGIYFVLGIFGPPLVYKFRYGWTYRKSIYEWFKYCNKISNAMMHGRIDNE